MPARASDPRVKSPPARRKRSKGRLLAASIAAMVGLGAELLAGLTGPDSPALVRPYEGCYYDAEAAERAVEFFGYLRHSKGEWAGQPFTLEEWQARMTRAVFGWLRPDGTRLISTVYLEVPRKNGKSTWVAGIALYLAVADREPGAEVYGIATDREQAEVVFGEAKRMVEASPDLSSVCTLFKTSIYVAETHSSYKTLSKKPKTGFNNHGNIVDELHEFKNRELWDAATTGTVARRQALTWAITTAGFDRNSICWQQHDYAEKVRDRIIDDPSFLGVIFAASEDDDWTSEETWKKANPNYGVSVKPEKLRNELKKALENGVQENVFKRYYLNIWTEQESRWLPIKFWDACRSVDPATIESLRGRRCYGGLDLANVSDIAALMWVFPDEIEREGKKLRVYDILARLWLPRDSADKRFRNSRIPYPTWADQGHITLTEGDVVDNDFIREQILQDFETFDVKELAFDPYNAIPLTSKLLGDGLPMLNHRQGPVSMNSPIKTFETLLKTERLRHDGSPVLRWSFGNIVVKADEKANLAFSKKRALEKIDPMVALAMALGRAEVLEDEGGSVYDKRGLIVL